MHLIYVDEAGTSAPEPITIVAAVIVHSDAAWREADAMLTEVLDELVPAQIREGYIFHAKEIIGGRRKLDASWSLEDRLTLISAVVSIPRLCGLAVTIGKVRRDAQEIEVADGSLRLEEWHHLHAFSRCIARANKYIGDWFPEDTLAVVVAENVPDKTRLLRAALRIPWSGNLAKDPFIIRTKEEIESGIIIQTDAGPADRVIDTCHFVEKNQAPLIQLADACAFTFRRFLNKQKGGDEFLSAMLDGMLEIEDWVGPSSDCTFSFHPDRLYSSK